MARTVNVPTGATEVWYAAPGLGDDESEYAENADCWVENLTDALTEELPSLEEPHRASWKDRESRVIARNRLGDFCLSEYCGLWALAFVPSDDSDIHGLAEAWGGRVYPRVAKLFGNALLQRVGSASNGETFFKRVAD